MTQSPMFRRKFLGLAALSTRLLEASSCSPSDADSARDLRKLARFPQKEPLILLTDRPPQLETPLNYFRQDLMPNSAYFVRWHVSGIPTDVNLDTWRLKVLGSVTHPLQLSMGDLRRRFEPVSLVALNQCSGNSRSLFEPHVPGGQWRHGAMGNARWTGVRLKDVLDSAGVAPRLDRSGLPRPRRSAALLHPHL